jgi:hypothetical protein
MKKMLGELLSSKKFAAMIVGMLSVMFAYPLSRWFGMDEAQAAEWSAAASTKAVALASAYCVGQGVADHGKEKAKQEKPTVTVTQ